MVMQVIEVLALSQEVEHSQEYEDYLESLIGNSNEIPESAYIIADYVQQKGNTLLGYKGGSAYKNIPANVSG